MGCFLNSCKSCEWSEAKKGLFCPCKMQMRWIMQPGLQPSDRLFVNQNRPILCKSSPDWHRRWSSSWLYNGRAALIWRWSQYLMKKDSPSPLPATEKMEDGAFPHPLDSAAKMLYNFLIDSSGKSLFPTELTDLHLCRRENCSPVPTAAWNSIIDARISLFLVLIHIRYWTEQMHKLYLFFFLQ